MEAKSSRKQNFTNVVMMGFFSAAVCVAGASHARGADAATPETAATPATAAAGIRAAGRAEFREKHHAALEACAKESGVTLLPGKRPTKDEREKMDSCMTAKGFPHSEKGERRGPRGKHHRGGKHGKHHGGDAPGMEPAAPAAPAGEAN